MNRGSSSAVLLLLWLTLSPTVRQRYNQVKLEGTEPDDITEAALTRKGRLCGKSKESREKDGEERKIRLTPRDDKDS